MSNEKKTLRLLVVDQSPDDTERLSEVLRRGGYTLKTQRVENLAGFQLALGKGPWDAVLSEYRVGSFGAPQALEALRRATLNVPVLLITSGMSDPDVAKCLREGIDDVVFKDQLGRLAPVLERVLGGMRERQRVQALEQNHAELEQKYRALVQGSTEAVCYSQDGMHTDVNAAYLALFGYASAEELEGIPVLNLVAKADQARFKDYLRKPGAAENEHREFLAVRADSATFPAEISIALLQVSGETWHQIIVSDLTKRRAAETKLQQAGQRDALTGLYNRHFFLLELGKAVEQAQQGKGDSAMLFVDLQQLRVINESVGYAAGDRMLLRLARLLKDQVGEEDILARFGGDEFALLLRKTDRARAEAMTQKLQQILKAQTFTEGAETIPCSCTVGMAPIDRGTVGAEKVLSQVHAAYDAARGAPPVPAPAPKPVAAPAVMATPTPQLAGNDPAVQAWKKRIEAALKSNRFQLIYQPIVNLHAEPVEWYEVLVRLSDEDSGMVAAGEFFPAAEACGLASALDHWVIARAIDTLAELHKGGRALVFSINLSNAALADAALAAVIGRHLKAGGLPAANLVFEIPETAFVHDPAGAARLAQMLRGLGCRTALDDFGAQVGPLDALQRAPLDFVKISGAWVGRLADEGGRRFIESALGVIKASNMQTIGKFIENADNLTTLWTVGLDYVQGHYFQPPAQQLNYAFGGEEVSSEHAANNWALNR